MGDLQRSHAGDGALAPRGGPAAAPPAGSLGDILERVLDKGIVIAGDIQVNLLDIELLTIRLRLIVASVDTARRMGINWWESDPRLTAGGDDRDKKRLRDDERDDRRLPDSERDERRLRAGDE